MIENSPGCVWKFLHYFYGFSFYFALLTTAATIFYDFLMMLSALAPFVFSFEPVNPYLARKTTHWNGIFGKLSTECSMKPRNSQ